jgi:hypothetical protein
MPMQTLNRRDLLLLGISRRTRSIELSCERLFMKYCDSQLDDSTQELFERLEFELGGVDNLRLVDTNWLTCEGFRDRLKPLLISVRARGGQVTYSNESTISSKHV